MKATKIPKRITPCPITEAIIEVRFESKLPREAVIGIAYEKFQKEFPTLEKLPILQLPEPILSQDSDLRFKPHYKLKGDLGPFLQVGPSVISFISTKEYVGWDAFSTSMKRILTEIQKTPIVNKVVRLGIRYINFFEDDVFNKIALKILDDAQPFKSENLTLRTIIKDGNFSHTLAVSNEATVRDQSGTRTGSLIDIDTHLDAAESLEKIVSKHLEDGHNSEKALFFGLLDPAYLASLKPEY